MLLVFTAKRGSIYCGPETVELLTALDSLGFKYQEVENLVPFPTSKDDIVEAVGEACLRDLNWQEFPWLYDTETHRVGRTLHDLEMSICTSSISESPAGATNSEGSNARERDQGSLEADSEVH